MPRRVRSLRCPTCKKLVLRNAPGFPFCSQRCRLIDLGKWASGGYVISIPVEEADPYGEGYTPRNDTSERLQDNSKQNDRKRS